MWLAIAKGTCPDQKFEQEFRSLLPRHQQLLYQAAFAYNNPFLHEPADLPIRPEQYSINLMWINKNKMPPEQEFLFGKGLNFEKGFISPVSNWAKKNPGSSINI